MAVVYASVQSIQELPGHALSSEFAGPKLRLLLSTLLIEWKQDLIHFGGCLRGRDKRRVRDFLWLQRAQAIHEPNDGLNLRGTFTCQPPERRQLIRAAGVRLDQPVGFEVCESGQ